MAGCVYYAYSDAIGWYVATQGATPPAASNCTLVIQTQEEWAAQSAPVSQFTADEVAALKIQAANPNPFNLSYQDGGLIGGAVALVWLTGWGIKALVQALNTDGEKET